MSAWLSFWTEGKFDLPTWTYIEVYLGAGIAQLIVVMAGTMVLVIAVIKSSKAMHDSAFLRVLHSPMSFFDTTPMGRILNRYEKRVGVEVGIHG
jgi:ABC-type multidrug transport system fused ATPase/permease subunit